MMTEEGRKWVAETWANRDAFAWDKPEELWLRALCDRVHSRALEILRSGLYVKDGIKDYHVAAGIAIDEVSSDLFGATLSGSNI